MAPQEGGDSIESPLHVVMLLSNAFKPDPRVLKEARSLASAGHRVTVLCWDRLGSYASCEEIEGFSVHRINVRSDYAKGSLQIFYLPLFGVRAIRRIFCLKPDVIHCHDLDTTLPGALAASICGLPWLFDAHECYPEQIRPQVIGPLYWLLLLLERVMARWATHVITVGEILAERFRSFGGRVTVVGNFQRMNTDAEPSGLSRRSLGLTPNDFVVAYIGGFTTDRVLWPLVEATRIFTRVTVLLVGDGPQRSAIEARLPRYPRVRYVGWVPQDMVPAYMALADVVYYGLNETHKNNRFSCPNALFDALVACKPVLTTGIGEIARIVQHHQCGLVVQNPTPVNLAAAMSQLSNPVLRRGLADNALKAAETRYNWTFAQKELLKVYDALGRLRAR